MGLTKSSRIPIIRILLSRIYVQEGGAKNVTGQEKSIFQGSTVIAGEFLDLAIVTDYIRKPEIMNLLPSKLNRILTERYHIFTDINLVIEPCPFNFNKNYDGDVFIIIGGPEFNAAAKYYFDENGTIMRFLPGKKGFEILRGISKGQQIFSHGENMNIALVQRQYYPDRNYTVFFLAGTGVNGTRAAMRYFVMNWMQLHKRFGDRDFVVCLQAESRRQNEQGYLRWNILRIIPES